MPYPSEYQQATDRFAQFLGDARDAAELGSRHQAYTMAQGVFRAFRRRLTLSDAILFAGILPVGLRALFVADWNTDEPVLPFEERENITKEVKSLRKDHNFSPDTAVHHVAVALRKNVDEEELEKVLAALPPGAREFWQV